MQRKSVQGFAQLILSRHQNQKVIKNTLKEAKQEKVLQDPKKMFALIFRANKRLRRHGRLRQAVQQPLSGSRSLEQSFLLGESSSYIRRYKNDEIQRQQRRLAYLRNFDFPLTSYTPDYEKRAGLLADPNASPARARVSLSHRIANLIATQLTKAEDNLIEDPEFFRVDYYGLTQFESAESEYLSQERSCDEVQVLEQNEKFLIVPHVSAYRLLYYNKQDLRQPAHALQLKLPEGFRHYGEITALRLFARAPVIVIGFMSGKGVV